MPQSPEAGIADKENDVKKEQLGSSPPQLKKSTSGFGFGRSRPLAVGKQNTVTTPR
jgi:hypothetical protein